MFPHRVFVVAALGVFFLASCGGGGGDNEGILSFTQLSYSVTESGTALNVITVQRLGGDGAVSARVVTENGSAVADVDYMPQTILVAWPAGDTSQKTIEIPILEDHSDEPDETITLRLTNPTGGATIRDPLGDTTLNIVDNDTGGTIQFNTSSYIFLEDGTPFGPSVEVTRTGGQDGDVSVTLTMTDGTANSDPNSAVEPVDYTPFKMMVTFVDQDATPVPISLAGVIRQDLLPEPAEMFSLVLGNPTGGAMIGPTSPASVAIGDDDNLLTIPNPETGTLFGAAVAKVGSKLYVGAPGNGAPAGRVHVIDPAEGMLVDTIMRPSSMALGSMLASGGSTVAVGSPGQIWAVDPDSLLDRYAPLTSAAPGFGQTAIITGDGRLVVGAPLAPASGGSTPAGAALVYDELTGVPLQTIAGTGDANLGSAFALIGADLLIGAPGGAGAVFRHAGAPFTLATTIDNPVPESPSAGFGRAILAIDADQAIYVGAPDADVSAIVDAGRVDLISPAGNATASPLVAGGRFGANLIVSGDFLFIESPGEGPLGSGRVWVYDKLLNQVFPMDDPTPTPGAGFGSAMCDFDGSIVIAAPQQAPGGAVYIVKLF